MIFISGFCFGASISLLAALWLIQRKMRGITKHARREIVERRWRDAPVSDVPPAWERQDTGIDYKWINIAGERE